MPQNPLRNPNPRQLQARRARKKPARRPADFQGTPLVLLKVAGDLAEGVGQLCADRGHRSDNHNGDQGRDQAVFDGGCARIVMREVLQGRKH